MDSITLKAHAKINLGLDVLGKREDGYHLVKMVMQSLSLCDELEMERIPEDEILLTTDVSGLPCDESNLVYKAVALMKKTYGIQEGVKMHLQKNIPMAAGLAGGSSDCAAALKGASKLFGLDLSIEELQQLGVKLGADVPYCLMGKTALSEGIGEVLSPLADLPDCHILLAKPPFDVSTKTVYQKVDSLSDYSHPDIDGMMEALRTQDLEGVCKRLGNVLESVTKEDYPLIGELEKSMLECDAIGSMMSGSGPTVFGIFSEEDRAKAAKDLIEKQVAGCSVHLTRPV